MPLPKSHNTFSRALNRHLSRSGLKVYDAASAWNVRHQRLYTWINGQCLPGRDEAERIGQAIGMPGLGDTVARLRRRRRALSSAGAA